MPFLLENPGESISDMPLISVCGGLRVSNGDQDHEQDDHENRSANGGDWFGRSFRPSHTPSREFADHCETSCTSGSRCGDISNVQFHARRSWRRTDYSNALKMRWNRRVPF